MATAPCVNISPVPVVRFYKFRSPEKGIRHEFHGQTFNPDPTLGSEVPDADLSTHANDRAERSPGTADFEIALQAILVTQTTGRRAAIRRTKRLNQLNISIALRTHVADRPNPIQIATAGGVKFDDFVDAL